MFRSAQHDKVLHPASGGIPPDDKGASNFLYNATKSEKIFNSGNKKLPVTGSF